MNKDLVQRIQSLTQGVCHRGLHDLEKPENSRAAFLAAIEAGLPFECDIHRTKDGKLCICHDSDLTRMTGKPGIIEELTLEQIQEEYALPDGSKIMEFEDMLHLNEGKVPMVLERKAYKGNAKELASLAIPIINQIPNVDECYLIPSPPRRYGKRVNVTPSRH